MSFVTTTLRDTVVTAAKQGGMVTIKAVFDNDTATNLILNGDALSGFVILEFRKDEAYTG